MSCLFESLSYYVQGTDASRLRHIICEFLKTNPTIFDNIKVDEITKHESGISLEQYIDNMRNQSTWGGGLEIKTFCDIFNIQVDVISLPNGGRKIEFIPNSGNPMGKIGIVWNGGHFTPINM